MVVAHQLLHLMGDESGHLPHPQSITIHGTEGVAVELAKCCHPIPGDPILGFIHKDRGLIIHTHDCPSIRGFRADPEKWLDVEWETEAGLLFDVAIKLVVANQRGVLAKVAAAISEQGINIGNIAMEEEDGSPYTVMFFTLQVENRDTSGQYHALAAHAARGGTYLPREKSKGWPGAGPVSAAGITIREAHLSRIPT